MCVSRFAVSHHKMYILVCVYGADWAYFPCFAVHDEWCCDTFWNIPWVKTKYWNRTKNKIQNEVYGKNSFRFDYMTSIHIDHQNFSFHILFVCGIRYIFHGIDKFLRWKVSLANAKPLIFPYLTYIFFHTLNSGSEVDFAFFAFDGC